MKGLTAGIIAGLAGAFAWALIAYFTGFEIGYLAWGIGALVGAAVAWGSEGSTTNGVIAVAISIVAILSGKFMAVEFSISKGIESVNQVMVELLQNDEYLISRIADDVAADLEEQGESINWPAETNSENAEFKDAYPPEIWKTAETVWAEKTDQQKQNFRLETEQEINDNLNDYAALASKEGFLASFGLFDAIFFFLAIGTAYKVAAKTDG